MTEGDDAVTHGQRPAMGLSHDDFFRVFPAVVAPAHWRREGLSIHVEWSGGARLTATVSEQKQRRIASLTLPYVDIGFAFRGMDELECQHFMARFDRAFQKGGG